MPRLNEEEAREFLKLLEPVDEDMREAMQDAYSDEMSSEEFEEKWGGSPGTIYVQAVRGKYLHFVENVYLRE
jgi:DNA-directed RNA polymerase specialized sigma24 family protein